MRILIGRALARSRTMPKLAEQTEFFELIRKGKVRSTATGGKLRSWVPTNVGGRHMSRPTGLVRDSSLWIEYGPRDCGILPGSADRSHHIRRFSTLCQRVKSIHRRRGRARGKLRGDAVDACRNLLDDGNDLLVAALAGRLSAVACLAKSCDFGFE